MDSSSVPRNSRPMTEDELSAVLQKWGPVHAPTSLEARVFGGTAHSSRSSDRMLFRSVMVPIPALAVVAAMLAGLTAWSVIVERKAFSVPTGSAPPLALSAYPESSLAISTDAANSGSWTASPEPQNSAASRVKVRADAQVMKIVRRVNPVYPPDAKAKRIGGSVVLHAIIATDGTVKELTALSGDPVFRSAAITAVRQWLYEPTLLNGKPVEVDTTVTVTFILGK